MYIIHVKNISFTTLCFVFVATLGCDDKSDVIILGEGKYKKKWIQDTLKIEQEFIKVGKDLIPHGTIKKIVTTDPVHHNDNLIYHATYDSGKLHGMEVSLYRNGNPRSLFFYKKGLKDSLSYFFYPNGLHKQISYWYEGNKTGLESYFDATKEHHLKDVYYDIDGNIFCEILYSKDSTIKELTGVIVSPMGEDLITSGDSVYIINRIADGNSKIEVKIDIQIIFEDKTIVADTTIDNFQWFKNCTTYVFQKQLVTSGRYKYIVTGYLIDKRKKNSII